MGDYVAGIKRAVAHSMAKLAYLDCPTGIAGDMCLGALVDAGVPLDYLVEQLATLGISDEYKLRAESVQRNGQRATKVHVDLKTLMSPSLHNSEASDRSAHSHHAAHLHHPVPSSSPTPTDRVHSASDHSHTHTRHLPDIEAMIQAAQLSPKAMEWSLAIFRQLAKAEGAVHGIPPSQVYFHEVGATDAIADIVGTCIGLDWLGIDHLYCSSLPTGGGTIRAAHGRLPVPAPAVLQLLQMGQVPIYSNGIQRELVTPTGAAIAITLATAFGAPPAMTLQTIGLGAGGRDLAIPNILRLWIGESTEGDRASTSHEHRQDHHNHHNQQDRNHSNTSSSLDSFASLAAAASPTSSPNASPPRSPEFPTQHITILETQLDDLNPQIIGYLFKQLLNIGALDVFTQAVGMKKSRPGILLTVICLPEQAAACEQMIYQETTTLGIRRRQQERSLLHREFHTVSTQYGNVRLKVAFAQPGAAILNVKPEYEDCARLAQQHHVPWTDINAEALQVWSKRRVTSDDDK